MDNYLLDSDDSDDSDNSNVKIKTYTPKELNSELLNKMNHFAGNFEDINMIGDIVGCRNYNTLIAFKLKNNGESFECIGRQWNINPEKVIQLENTHSKIRGNIIANVFHGPRFQFNVTDIELETDDTKLKSLKEQCKEKGYFVNKKNIPWDNIKNIGIISKTNTQGYNDFMKQFKIPASIITEEITLEGGNTSNQCIQSIRKLQNVDIIMIIRGGGDTSEISNSFDTIELFDTIHKSNVPIITAIGHEADTGDKLLITTVSDYDFPTPSTASIEITKILLNPIIKKIDNELSKIDSLLAERIYDEYNKSYNILKCLFNNYKNAKFGGQIMKIDDSIKYIIIEKDGSLYRNLIHFDDKLDFTTDEVIECEKIGNAIDDHKISIIQTYFADITVDITVESINDQIKEVIKIHKMEDDFEKVKPKKMMKLYCKEYNLNSFTIKKLIQLYSMVLWYKISLEGESSFKEIFNYYNCIV
jgi:exodeoxyribonuclease VII large subunit